MCILRAVSLARYLLQSTQYSSQFVSLSLSLLVLLLLLVLQKARTFHMYMHVYLLLKCILSYFQHTMFKWLHGSLSGNFLLVVYSDRCDASFEVHSTECMYPSQCVSLYNITFHDNNNKTERRVKNLLGFSMLIIDCIKIECFPGDKAKKIQPHPNEPKWHRHRMALVTCRKWCLQTEYIHFAFYSGFFF